MLRIADLGIRWISSPDPFFTHFEGSECGKWIMELSCGTLLSSFGISYHPPGACAHLLLSEYGGSLTANEDWSRVTAYAPGAKDPERALILAALCSRFAFFDTVLLHASFVDYQGDGIVFVGPSGIGKTTQAQLWNEHLGADIVNGDKVLLRRFSDEICAYGLPWKGSSPYCLNRKAPVRGIVALRQAETNRIRRLSSLECIEYFVPHVFLPYWDAQCVERALDTVDQIVSRIPVWLLECRPDADAVLLTKETILR